MRNYPLPRLSPTPPTDAVGVGSTHTACMARMTNHEVPLSYCRFHLFIFAFVPCIILEHALLSFIPFFHAHLSGII